MPVGLFSRALEVLTGVAAGRVSRDRLYGDLAPWMLDDHPVSLEITVLAVLGLVRLDPFGIGPPVLTRRGRRVQGSLRAGAPQSARRDGSGDIPGDMTG